MGSVPIKLSWLTRAGLWLALAGALFTASVLSPGAANTAPASLSAARHGDLLAPQDRSVLPRKARFVQAAVAPQPDRPKHLGGFKDKARAQAENDRECGYAPPRFASRPAPQRAGRVCFFAWFSRAPPALPA